MDRVRGKKTAPAKIAYAVYERDRYTCQDCGKVGRPGRCGEDIQAHHILPYADGGTHALSNLITLCVFCHRKRDKMRTNQLRAQAAAERCSKLPPRPLTLARVATALGVCIETVADWRRLGIIPRFTDTAELESYAASDDRQRSRKGVPLRERIPNDRMR